MAKLRQGLIDVVKPVCPGWHHHYQLRRWVASLPSRAYIVNDGVYLIVASDPDPCKWYVTVDDMLTPSQRWSRIGGTMMEAFYAGLEQGMRDLRNAGISIKNS